MLLREFKEEVSKQCSQILYEISSMRTHGDQQADTIRSMVQDSQDESKEHAARMDTILKTSEEAVRLLGKVQESVHSARSPESTRSPGRKRLSRDHSLFDSEAMSLAAMQVACDSTALAALTGDEVCELPPSTFSQRTSRHKSKGKGQRRDSSSSVRSPAASPRPQHDSPRQTQGGSPRATDVTTQLPPSPKSELSPQPAAGSRKKKKKKRAKDASEADGLVGPIGSRPAPPAPSSPTVPALSDTHVDQLNARIAHRIAMLPVLDNWKPWMLQRDTRLGRLVRSHCFFVFINGLILFNVVFVSLQAQHRVDRAERSLQQDAIYSVADIIFSFLFAVEFTMRLFGDRAYFFFGPEKTWNAMDMIFVAFDFANVLLDLSMGEGSIGDVDGIRGAVRVLRLMRAARVARLLRLLHSLKFIKMCRLLVDIIQASIGFSLCVMTAMAALFVLFSVIFMQATADSLINDETDTALSHHFSSIRESMLTLFWCMTGQNVEGVYDALAGASSLYAFSLVIFVFFMTYAFANSVTGAMVEYALKASTRYELEGQIANASAIENILVAADTDFSGSLNKEEITRCMDRTDVQEKFGKLGIEASEARALFDIMAPNPTTRVDVKSLSQVYARVTRTVRSADFVQILLSSHRLLDDMKLVKHLLQVCILGFPPPAAAPMRRAKTKRVSEPYSGDDALCDSGDADA